MYMAIWRRVNLVISNTLIPQDRGVFIWQQLNLTNFLNSPNKSSPIINNFTVIIKYMSV